MNKTLLIVAIGYVVLLAGCSGGGNPGNSGPAAPPAQAIIGGGSEPAAPPAQATDSGQEVMIGSAVGSRAPAHSQ